MGKPTTISHRVTNIYRREASGWKMVHRHTDLNPAKQDVSRQLHSSQERPAHDLWNPNEKPAGSLALRMSLFRLS